MRVESLLLVLCAIVDVGAFRVPTVSLCHLHATSNTKLCADERITALTQLSIILMGGNCLFRNTRSFTMMGKAKGGGTSKTVQVLLTENVEGLGKKNELIAVKPAYAV